MIVKRNFEKLIPLQNERKTRSPGMRRSHSAKEAIGKLIPGKAMANIQTAKVATQCILHSFDHQNSSCPTTGGIEIPMLCFPLGSQSSDRLLDRYLMTIEHFTTDRWGQNCQRGTSGSHRTFNLIQWVSKNPWNDQSIIMVKYKSRVKNNHASLYTSRKVQRFHAKSQDKQDLRRPAYRVITAAKNWNK